MGEALSEERLAELKRMLCERRRALAEEERGSAAWRGTVELDQQSVGRLSRMDALQQQAMSAAEARRREADLKRIDAALERMESGDYGYCLACGEEIAERRLAIDPAATHCVGCAR